LQNHAYSSGRVTHGAGSGACVVDTAAVVVADAVAPALSRTVSVTVNVPLVEYTCDAVADDELVSDVPSPHRHV
jgi:hypothetical protein